MSGEDIPYQLRPNKFIDRQMFVELLSRLIVPRGPEKYIYVSMGGRHLIDHYAVYNKLGVEAQYSFDQNANEVKRQKFNRPTGKTICVELNSADLPSTIDGILAKFPSKRNLIVWLDYTSTQRRSQFQEAVQTLVRLKHGDVFRITLNANPETLCSADQWRKAGASSPAEYRASQLREQIQEYMPTDVTFISEHELPRILARCVELAVTAAEAQQPKLLIRPALITSYRDGQRMLTVTCSVCEIKSKEPFPPPMFSRWRYSCGSWADIQGISAPVLSTKEQNRIDTRLHRGASDMLAALKFLPSEDKKKSLEALRSYRDFHRFYPSFRSVEE
jgi:hypothetical protein